MQSFAQNITLQKRFEFNSLIKGKFAQFLFGVILELTFFWTITISGIKKVNI